MYPKVLLSGFLLIFFSAIHAQKPNQPMLNYTQSWKEAEAFEEKQLPESALEVVNKIYNAAQKENNTVQIIKAIIHKLQLTALKEEDPVNNNVKLLQEEIEKAGFPVQQVLHSMLAEAYWQYFVNNRYRFSERSQTANFDNKDIATWSLSKIVEKTIYHYEQSLVEAEKLKKTPISKFQQILSESNKLGKEYRPTLFDFLAHRAVDLFSNNEPDLIKPAYSFTINKQEYFSEAALFAKMPVETRDTFAYKYYALKIFQELISFHLNDATPEALIDVDLKRLEFVNQYSVLPDKQDLYLHALQNLDKKNRRFSVSTMVLYKTASLWNQQGDLFNPLKEDEYKWNRKKAYELCNEAIKRFPESNGAKEAFNLQQIIQVKNITASVEKVNVPGQPFRALVGYKNFTKLYWRAIPVSYNEVSQQRIKWGENNKVDQEQMFLEYFISKSPIKEGTLTLPSDSDFYEHSAEIKIDPLEPGTYMILFASSGNFSTKTDGLAYAFTTISNLAYFHRNRNNGTTDLYIVDRTSGEPVKGAEARLYFSQYNDKAYRYNLVPGESFVSDDEGYVHIPHQLKKVINQMSSFELKISYHYDTIQTNEIDNPGWYYSRIAQHTSAEKQRREQTYFFLDRAIYRPGQTIYFKGLLTDTDGKTPKIINNRTLIVSFLDVNAQVLGKQLVTTSDYGTFNGSFTAP